MIDGHGDDAYKYGQKIRINFSSNVYNHVNHNGLREHLYHRMESIQSYPEPELLFFRTGIGTFASSVGREGGLCD